MAVLGDELFWPKLWWTVVLLVVTVVFCALPFVILRRTGKYTKRVMSYMNVLAGGVVMGALLMHMIPELLPTHHHHDHGHPPSHSKDLSSRHPGTGVHRSTSPHGNPNQHHSHEDHSHEENSHEGHEHHSHNEGGKKDGSTKKKGSETTGDKKHEGCEYPWGPLAAGISFLCLFAIDRLFIHHSHHSPHDTLRDVKGEEEVESQEPAVCDHEHDQCIQNEPTFKQPQHLPSPPTHPHDHQHHVHDLKSCNHHHSHHHQEDAHRSEECCDHCTIDVIPSLNDGDDDVEETHLAHNEIHDDDGHDEHASCHSHDVVGGCHMDGFTKTATQQQTYVFIVALSMHSFLEGLGFASKHSASVLVSFLVSLFAHKWLEAFALGIAVARAEYSRWRTLGLLALYCVLTPLGMLSSLILKHSFSHPHSSTNALASKVTLWMDGFAAGSFLFVALIEMIPPEFHTRDRHTPFKFLLLCAGFAAMAVIQAFHRH